MIQVLNTFRHIAHVQYDLYHNLDNHQATLDRMVLSPKLIGILNSRRNGTEGTLILAPHLSNFDLAGRAMALNGFDIQVLSYPQPHGGYQWQNRLRKEVGIDVSPMSTESLRRAKARLLAGGLVISGLGTSPARDELSSEVLWLPCACSGFLCPACAANEIRHDDHRLCWHSGRGLYFGVFGFNLPAKL